MITFTQKGDFRNTERFLDRGQKFNAQRILERYAYEGVSALTMSTPVDTGLTAASWSYTISVGQSKCSIIWVNNNNENGAPVAILIQYGHGTKDGAYIQGIDYINPAIRPILDKIAQSLYEEVSNL